MLFSGYNANKTPMDVQIKKKANGIVSGVLNESFILRSDARMTQLVSDR